MSDIAIRVEGLSKRYAITQGGTARYKSLRDAISNTVMAPFRRSARQNQVKGEFWALKDINFEVKSGEVIGLIGRNGAGKSTLLKVLSRITEPTSGFAEIHGRVGSLLEVGTGFHPELSGRENIFLNGAILGMRRHEILRKFDEIVSFAEIERFIDQPVKFYSSGMFVRLAFAVAAHLEPEILFVDEVLAVGDALFQKKCLGKMNDVAKSGRTVVLVSHNMGAISELCTHGVLLEKGMVSLTGEIKPVVDGYARLLTEDSAGVELADHGGDFAITSVSLENTSGDQARTFDTEEDIVLTITYRLREKMNGLIMAAQLSRNFVDIVYSYDTDDLDEVPMREPGLYKSRMRIPGHFLKGGHYSIRVAAGAPNRLLADHPGVLQFDIEELSQNFNERSYRADRPGHIIFPGKWTIQREE